MADFNAQSQVRAMLEAGQKAGQSYTRLFDNNIPPAPKSILGSLATLPATRPANTEWVPPDRQSSPREPPSPRPAPAPPSPQEAMKQAVRDQIALADQQATWLQELLQLQQERAERLQRVASLQHKLQATSQPVRFCRHCNRPLYIHLADGTLEPCTRSNRFCCGYDPERQLVGYLDCIQGRNATKGRRKYAARKTRDQARRTAPELYAINGLVRPQ